MQIHRKFPVLGCVLLLACFLFPGENAQGADKQGIRPWPGDLPVRSSWLRKHLPKETLMYLRLPHPVGFLAAPKGNAMDSVLRSTANVESLTRIQSALIENVLEHVPGLEEAYLREFAEQLRSPIEFAMTLVPAPSVIVAMNLASGSNEQFANMISQVTIGATTLSLLAPLDTDGFGQILGLPVPTAVYFDAGSGQLLLQAGPAVSADLFATLVASIAEPAEHPMHAMERRVDTSGYGWFFWVDAQNTIPAARTFMNEEQLTELEESGFDKIRAAALGWGAANDKGRLSIIVDMPADGGRKFLPYISNDVSATSVGEPDAVVVFSVPTGDEFMRIEALLLGAASEETRNAWIRAKAQMEETTGTRIEDILNAIGPEVIGIFDDAGDYAAIRLRDPQLFDEFVDKVSALSGNAPLEHRYKRQKFYHWSFASEPETIDETQADIESFGPLAFILSRQRKHFHWYRDGDFLYLASVPQPLIDRIDAGADTNIAAWLEQRQNMDVSTALLAASGTSDKLPRRIYHLYLELLQAAADISEADFDIWKMPTASQAALPEKGALGFSVNLGDPYLSIEFMFENNPLESLFSGNMTSVAAVGVLAAIGIPAYQDYTIRTRVSQGINEAQAATSTVTAHYRSHGSFPGPTAAAEISDRVSAAEYAESISVVPGIGVIVITYAEEDLPEGGELYLEPVIAEDDSVSWHCSATIEDKHLPASCRGNTPPELMQGGT